MVRGKSWTSEGFLNLFFFFLTAVSIHCNEVWSIYSVVEV